MPYDLHFVEETIIQILKRNIDEPNIDIKPTTSFTDLDLDSLRLMMVLSDLEQTLDLPPSVSFEPGDIYRYPTVHELAAQICQFEEVDYEHES